MPVSPFSSAPGAQVAEHISFPAGEGCHPSRASLKMKRTQKLRLSVLCPQRLPNCTRAISHQPLRALPPQHQAEGWKGQKPGQQALPPGGYSPFSVYLPQPPSHQQSLGHQKLQTTCQAECHCDSINDKSGTGSKKDYVKLGHRLQDTPVFPQETPPKGLHQTEERKSARSQGARGC